MIGLHEVGKNYGPVEIGPLTFTVESGSITGLLGPNGSGKTTTLCRMVGLLGGTGSTLFGGRHYSDLRNPQQIVGMMFDGVPAHPGRSAIGHLRLAATSADVDHDRCDELMGLVGLEYAAKRRIDKLSLGMRQRLGIACALIGNPHYLLLDEPSIGLDPVANLWFRDLLRGLAANGSAVLLSTHHLDLVESVADRAVVLSKGKMRADLALEDLDTELTERTIEITCELPHKAIAALATDAVGQCDSVWGNTLSVRHATIEDVGRCLVKAGVGISAIRYGSGRLQDMYLSIMDGIE